MSNAAARLAELVALLAEPQPGTRAKPPAERQDAAIERLAEALLAGASLPAAPRAYERLTGALPFQADSLSALVSLKVAERYLPPSSHDARVPGDVDALLATALCSHADQRPSAEDIATGITELLEDHPLAAATEEQ